MITQGHSKHLPRELAPADPSLVSTETETKPRPKVKAKPPAPTEAEAAADEEGDEEEIECPDEKPAAAVKPAAKKPPVEKGFFEAVDEWLAKEWVL